MTQTDGKLYHVLGLEEPILLKLLYYPRQYTDSVQSLSNCCCCCSVTKLYPTLWDPMDCSMPGFPVRHHLPEFAQVHAHWIGVQSSHALPPSFPFAFNLSQHQGLFQWVGVHIRWPKYWSFSISISPSNEYSGLISFRTDWFDHLTIQGILKSFLQHHSSKVSILQHSAFLMVQLSHLYVTTGKTIALTIWTFVGKVIALLFNMLSKFVKLSGPVGFI